MTTGLKTVAGALATADVVAHLAFLAIFGWRSLASFGPMKLVAGVFALLALVGLVLAFVGKLLVKHGGRTPAGKVGIWAVGGSTGLAGLLLVLASWTSG
jgi:hypothetical protein